MPTRREHTMKSLLTSASRYAALFACLLAVRAHAAPINNGGFQAGLSSWVTANQLGSDGSFVLQTGTASPVNGFTVPAPPEGTTAAMTDAQGPGSHLLYQDFVVPVVNTSAVLQFSLYVRNSDTVFRTPASLDFSTPTLNQQARVDITTTSADPFSLAAGVVLQNVFQTAVGSPLISGYNTIQVNVTSLMQAHQGETLRLRFAEVDNVAPFNLGVDNVAITVDAIPEPSTWVLVGSGLLVAACSRRRK